MLKRIAAGRTDLVFDWIAGGQPAQGKNDSGVELIRWCSYYGDVSAIGFLLQNGESLESLGFNRGLNESAFHGHWRLCQFLLENGADADLAIPETGETPLHLAVCKAIGRPSRGWWRCSWPPAPRPMWSPSPEREPVLSCATSAPAAKPRSTAPPHGDFRISPQRQGKYDHGRDWGTLDAALLGEPLD